jgi:hypothetical protein
MHFPLNFPFELRFLISLVVTVVIETAVIVCYIRFFYKIPARQLSMPRILFAGFFASFATLPYLWFVLPPLVRPYWLMVTTGEAGVFILEAMAYIYLLNLPFRKTIVLSVAANIASIIVGLLALPPF